MQENTDQKKLRILTHFNQWKTVNYTATQKWDFYPLQKKSEKSEPKEMKIYSTTTRINHSDVV